MKKLLIMLVACCALMAGGSEAYTGGVKPSGESILENEYDKSAAIFKESCEKGHLYNCYNLAKFYLDGRGVIQSEANAIKYYQIACDGKLPYACSELAIIWQQNGDVKKANEQFNHACDLGDDKACLALAVAYFDGNGVKKDLQKAKKLSQKSCKMGNEIACKAYENIKNSK
ncbi:Putative beta-lactamase HcpC [Campylobacter majalis]|uniref:beta-lactamase n=1 Tax=Campylobacter majalis TaxID=2790656 RepID=A0ABM8Q8A5_9BACT|nr:tetratricopeptide repeat protein [Campylobacter majalis]CAD7289120.1 Putative beta-lactamase HcpC [Campylobacter majalis]